MSQHILDVAGENVPGPPDDGVNLHELEMAGVPVGVHLNAPLNAFEIQMLDNNVQTDTFVNSFFLDENDKVQNINNDPELTPMIVSAIEENNEQQLRYILEQHPNLDLSRFPGRWHSEDMMTPLALCFRCGHEGLFMLLLHKRVKLEQVWKVNDLNNRFDGFHMTVLSYIIATVQNLDDRMEYAVKLFHWGARVFNPDLPNYSQPTYILQEQIRNCSAPFLDPSTEIRNKRRYRCFLKHMLKKVVLNGGRNGALFLMDTYIPLHGLSSLLLYCLQKSNSFEFLQNYDLSQLRDNEATRKIFEILEEKRLERERAFGWGTVFPAKVLKKIFDLTTLDWLTKNYRGCHVDNCVVCMSLANLHVVCKYGHRLCSICRVDMRQHSQHNCPYCRAPMIE